MAIVPPVWAEWYVGGYGGFSSIGKITDVELPTYSDALVSSDPRFQNPSSNSLFQLSNNMQASDIKLKDSIMFGARVGHFFNRLGFPWLGLEIEGYTLEPKVKAQTLNATQTVTRYNPSLTPAAPAGGGCPAGPDSKPVTCTNNVSVPLTESSLRVTTLALNLLVRYPAKWVQPYVGVGLGGFWFNGTGQFDGSKIFPGLNALGGFKVRVSDHWGIFAETKYNRVSINGMGPTLGVQGTYSIFSWVGGISYSFE